MSADWQTAVNFFFFFQTWFCCHCSFVQIHTGSDEILEINQNMPREMIQCGVRLFFFFTLFITSGWVKFRFSCLSVCLYFINLLSVNSVFSEHFILIIRIEMSYSFHKTFSVWNSSLLFILSMNLDVYTFFFLWLGFDFLFPVKTNGFLSQMIFYIFLHVNTSHVQTISY